METCFIPFLLPEDEHASGSNFSDDCHMKIAVEIMRGAIAVLEQPAA